MTDRIHHLNEGRATPHLSVHSSSSSGFLFLFSSLILPSHHCFNLLSLTSYLSASHSPSEPLQQRHPPFVCSESQSAPQGLKVNSHEHTTTPQRVFKPVISYCEFTLVCLCSSGNYPLSKAFYTTESFSPIYICLKFKKFTSSIKLWSFLLCRFSIAPHRVIVNILARMNLLPLFPLYHYCALYYDWRLLRRGLWGAEKYWYQLM